MLVPARTLFGLLSFAILGLAAWFLPPILARLDTGDESRPERGSGVQTPGSRGHMLYVEEHGPADGYPLILAACARNRPAPSPASVDP